MAPVHATRILIWMPKYPVMCQSFSDDENLVILLVGSLKDRPWPDRGEFNSQVLSVLFLDSLSPKFVLIEENKNENENIDWDVP